MHSLSVVPVLLVLQHCMNVIPASGSATTTFASRAIGSVTVTTTVVTDRTSCRRTAISSHSCPLEPTDGNRPGDGVCRWGHEKTFTAWSIVSVPDWLSFPCKNTNKLVREFCLSPHLFPFPFPFIWVCNTS